MTNLGSNLTVETEDSFSSLLELAAENDAERFRRSIDRDQSAIDEVGLWYTRKKGLKQMGLVETTPLMVAASYGSLDVLQLLLAMPTCDVNRSCGAEMTTALHCAASGGSANSVEAVKLLISAGADVGAVDVDSRRPADLVAVGVSSNALQIKLQLEELLCGGKITPSPHCSSSSSPSSSFSSSSLLQSSFLDEESSSSSDSTTTPSRKEYPVDPSIPDINNSMYGSDEFRMFSFKVRPCSRAYSHDWTECPFVHPGENARRRDPRKYHYSCMPCPEFRKGVPCRRGDLCEYAHGVFECWLHPAQYRTRLCKDGTACARRVCFFAHTPQELRPLFLSTHASDIMPASPPPAPPPPPPFTPPISPNALHLPMVPGNSRMRSSSLSSRDMRFDDRLSDYFDMQHLKEFCFSPTLTPTQPPRLSGSRAIQFRSLTNLDDLLSAENIALHNALLHSSLGVPSPGRMSPHGIEQQQQHSPLSTWVSAFAREKLLNLRGVGELGYRSADVGSPASSPWGANWGSPGGKVDWGFNAEELRRLRDELSVPGKEPDVSWAQSLVSPQATTSNAGSSIGDGSNSNGQAEERGDAVLGAWLEQMQLDRLVA